MKPARLSLLLLIIVLVAPGPALGKVPWSSVEIEPATPAAGEPLTLVIRFWDDVAHTRPSSWSPDAADHGAVLELIGPGGRVPVTLIRTGEGVFSTEVALSEGTWRLVASQEFSGATGPTDVELATVTVAARDATAPIGAALVGIGAVVAGAIWHRRRVSSPS